MNVWTAMTAERDSMEFVGLNVPPAKLVSGQSPTTTNSTEVASV